MVAPHYSLRALAAVFLAISSTVHSHMVMVTPQPYGKSTLNNSPLNADGSDFPCKQRTGVYNLEGASNVMAVGSTNTLSFMGSAVHGGGSCQVSLTTDANPTKNSKWMVIHSIIGNCPSDATGNLPSGSATDLGAKKFSYTIPAGIAPGQYTIAWTWVNKVGNREFYMNCGPATITAAAKKRYAPEPKIDRRQTSSFPEMFLANMGAVSNGCSTTSNTDALFPNPGASVEYGTVGVNTVNSLVGNCGQSAAGSSGGSSGSSSGSSSSGSSPAPSSAAGGAGTSNGVPAASSVATGGFASGSAAAAASHTASSVAFSVTPVGTGAATPATPAPAAISTAVVSPIPAASSSYATAPAASPASSAAPAASPGAAAGALLSGPCTPEGEWSCAADGASFQRCASGSWSAPISMAAGTTCTPGQSNTLSVTKRQSPHARRSLMFGRAVHHV